MYDHHCSGIECQERKNSAKFSKSNREFVVLWDREKNWPFDFYIEFDLEAIEEMALCVPTFILESLFWL